MGAGRGDNGCTTALFCALYQSGSPVRKRKRKRKRERERGNDGSTHVDNETDS